jgi:hypothetical protein
VVLRGLLALHGGGGSSWRPSGSGPERSGAGDGPGVLLAPWPSGMEFCGGNFVVVLDVVDVETQAFCFFPNSVS